jgi:hypothetical protein
LFLIILELSLPWSIFMRKKGSECLKVLYNETHIEIPKVLCEDISLLGCGFIVVHVDGARLYL